MIGTPQCSELQVQFRDISFVPWNRTSYDSEIILLQCWCRGSAHALPLTLGSHGSRATNGPMDQWTVPMGDMPNGRLEKTWEQSIPGIILEVNAALHVN